MDVAYLIRELEPSVMCWPCELRSRREGRRERDRSGDGRWHEVVRGCVVLLCFVSCLKARIDNETLLVFSSILKMCQAD